MPPEDEADDEQGSASHSNGSRMRVLYAAAYARASTALPVVTVWRSVKMDFSTEELLVKLEQAGIEVTEEEAQRFRGKLILN